MQTEPLFAPPPNARKLESMGIQMGWTPWTTYAGGPDSVVVRLRKKGTCPIYGMWVRKDDGGFGYSSGYARCCKSFGYKEILNHLEAGCDHTDLDLDRDGESCGVESPNPGSEADGLEGGPVRGT